jgi:CRP-like cAMP-binding protein
MGSGASFKQKLCEMIEEAQLFSDLEWDSIDQLSGYLQCYKVPAGTVIFKEGDVGSYMSVVVIGKIEITKEAQNGKQHLLTVITQGKAFGEMSIIDNEHRSASCRALCDSVLLILTKQNYVHIIKERPNLAVIILSRLAKLMSQRLRSLSGQLVDYL